MGIFDTFWLATTLRSATPLMYAATGEVIAERTGILNIGLEGMMLAGAFFGFLAVYLWDSFILGVIIAAVAGAGFASLMALLSIYARANQIVVGIGINVLALGVTSFVFRDIFPAQVTVDRPSVWVIPGLSAIPVVGDALFSQPAWVYFALLTAPLAWFFLYRTSWGLAMRAAGEVPQAVDTAGPNTQTIRFAGTLIAGALAGIGGSFLSIQLGLFVEGMTNGRGFLALAAVIFGRWRPAGVLGACLMFGAADALQVRLQGQDVVPPEVWAVLAGLGPVYLVIRHLRGRRVRFGVVEAGLAGVTLVAAVLWVVQPDVSLPSQLWRTVPFVLSLAVLAGVIGRSRMPTALGVPYQREADA